jgi:hypothetical protein
MENEFIPYEQALALKELGFDEPCFAFFNGKHHDWLIDDNNRLDAPTINVNKEIGNCIKRPLYSQAFKFFREKYKFHAEIRSYTAKYFTIIIQELKDIVRYLEYGGIDLKFNTYEEAELECLKKLIEIVKNGR